MVSGKDRLKPLIFSGMAGVLMKLIRIKKTASPAKGGRLLVIGKTMFSFDTR